MTFPPPFSQVLPAMAALDTKRRCSLHLSRSTPMSLEEILSYLHPPCRNNSRCQGFAALVELRNFVCQYRRKRALLSRFGQKAFTQTTVLN